jgi:hypothetical protein
MTKCLVYKAQEIGTTGQQATGGIPGITACTQGRSSVRDHEVFTMEVGVSEVVQVVVQPWDDPGLGNFRHAAAVPPEAIVVVPIAFIRSVVKVAKRDPN